MKVYLGGPMTGIPEGNVPAFRDATDDLRSRGHQVLSPVEMDEAEGYDATQASNDNEQPEQYAHFLARDILRIAEEEVDAIVVLPGWENSGGANTEVAFMRALKKPVLRYPELVDIDASAASMNPKDRIARQQGKVPLHYLEPAAEIEIARALESGALKYGYRNFTIEPIKATVYIDAFLRHVYAWRDGEDVDKDSGRHPLAHVGANVHVALAAMAAGKFIDDRAGAVIREAERVLAASAA